MKYRVTAPLVVAPDQDGRSHHWYFGQVIPWLSRQWRDHLLGKGMVEELPAPPGVVPPEVAPEPGQPEPAVPEPTVRPPQVAPKEAWVDYAVNGLGLDRVQAEAMTKADLIAAAG